MGYMLFFRRFMASDIWTDSMVLLSTRRRMIGTPSHNFIESARNVRCDTIHHIIYFPSISPFVLYTTQKSIDSTRYVILDSKV